MEYGTVTGIEKTEAGHFVVKTDGGKDYETKTIIIANKQLATATVR